MRRLGALGRARGPRALGRPAWSLTAPSVRRTRLRPTVSPEPVFVPGLQEVRDQLTSEIKREHLETLFIF